VINPSLRWNVAICVAVLLAWPLSQSAMGWQVTTSGSACTVDAAQAVAVDGSGDVVAAGVTANETFGGDFTVVKLASATGQERWRQVIDGDVHAFDSAQAVTVDSSGDVVAAGGMQMMERGFDFAVVKLRGSDGAILWRRVIDNSEVKLSQRQREDAGPDDDALKVTTDPSGDVIAAGVLAGYENLNGLFFVIKLRGSDGTELWHYAVGDWSPGSQADTVIVDKDGDVLAGGFTTDFLRLFILGPMFTVVKLDGATGAELWQGNAAGEAQSLSLTPEGDVVGTGSRIGALSTIRLRGSDGAIMWRNQAAQWVSVVTANAAGAIVAGAEAVFALNPTDGTQMWYRSVETSFEAAATDRNGDVFAAGYSAASSVLKLNAATGMDLWPAPADPDALLDVKALAVDSEGDVVAAGSIGPDFVVAKLNGRDGSSFGVPRCAGDCNHDGRVGVDELVNGVNVALGAATVCTCSSFDGDHDRKVTVDELVRGVDAALNGCGG